MHFGLRVKLKTPGKHTAYQKRQTFFFHFLFFSLYVHSTTFEQKLKPSFFFSLISLTILPCASCCPFSMNAFFFFCAHILASPLRLLEHKYSSGIRNPTFPPPEWCECFDDRIAGHEWSGGSGYDLFRFVLCRCPKYYASRRVRLTF